MNYAESSAILEQFERRGYVQAHEGEVADAIVVNTCSVTEQAETECHKIVRRLRRSSPGAVVAITGCYAQLRPTEVAAIEGVDIVVGTATRSTIADRVDVWRADDGLVVDVPDLTDDLTFMSARTTDGDARTRAFVKVQDGCDYSCSFCTIPAARGASRSMPLVDVHRALGEVARAGFHEVVLTGINLGEYRTADGLRFVDLVRSIDDVDTGLRYRVSSIEPNTITSELIAAIAASPRFCRHWHVPLQSGSATVLRRMRRRYQPATYASVLEALAKTMPGVAIGVDVIAGFPGETEAEFGETCRLLEQLPWTYLHAFPYSERPGTPAADAASPVPVAVRRERVRILRAMSASRRRRHEASHRGAVQTFLPEGFDAATSTWHGWTEYYVRVHVEAPPVMPYGPHRVVLTNERSQGDGMSARLVETSDHAPSPYYALPL